MQGARERVCLWTVSYPVSDCEQRKKHDCVSSPADLRILADRNNVTFIFKASILDSREPAFEGI